MSTSGNMLSPETAKGNGAKTGSLMPNGSPSERANAAPVKSLESTRGDFVLSRRQSLQPDRQGDGHLSASKHGNKALLHHAPTGEKGETAALTRGSDA